MLNKFSSLYENLLIKIANKDKKDNFKNLFIFLMGIKKIFSKNNTALNWFKVALNLKRYYKYDENYYKNKENTSYEEYLNSCEKVILWALPKKEDKILDIGCGKGFLVDRLNKKGYDIIGIERKDFNLKEKVSEKVFIKDLNDFKKNSFKIISLFSVLEHIEKNKIDEFLKITTDLTSDWIICSLPVYPDNLKVFYDDLTHQIFERKEFWIEKFKKLGFYLSYLPEENLSFVNVFIFRKIKKDSDEVLDLKNKNLIRMRMSIGDEICALVVLEEIKKRFKDIKLLISKDSFYKELFINNNIFESIREEGKEKDNIIDFSFPRNLSIHLIEDFALQMGIKDIKLNKPNIYLNENDKIDYNFLDYKYLAVDIRSGWVSRKWDKKNFEEVCKILREKYNVKIIEVGKNNWGAGAKNIKEESLKNADFSFVNKLNLRQTAYIISKCGFFLGNDSGLAHLAVGVNAKAFVLFGPAEAKYREHKGYTISFYNEECYGCYTKNLYDEKILKQGCPLKHHKCMKNIKVQEVVERIIKEMFK